MTRHAPGISSYAHFPTQEGRNSFAAGVWDCYELWLQHLNVGYMVFMQGPQLPCDGSPQHCDLFYSPTWCIEQTYHPYSGKRFVSICSGRAGWARICFGLLRLLSWSFWDLAFSCCVVRSVRFCTWGLRCCPDRLFLASFPRCCRVAPAPACAPFEAGAA